MAETAAQFEDVRREMAAFVERQLEPLDELASTLRTLFGRTLSGRTLSGRTELGRVPESTLTTVLPELREGLLRSDALVGLGFAAEPGVMEDADSYLLWFQKDRQGVSRLALNIDASDPGFYDYHDTDWFAGARALRARSIYGPYLDYAGADQLIHTVAVPIEVGGTFVGVAAGDLGATAVEAGMLALIGRLSCDAVLATRDRVVVASTGSRWLPGERLPALPVAGEGGWAIARPVTDWTGWVLAAR